MSASDPLVSCHDCPTRRPASVMREAPIVLENGAQGSVLVCPRCDNRRQPSLSDFSFTPGGTKR